ncbi:MAG: hypothetical protein BMS9Abin36_0277 [Gammaproteobacteria bacterium]|nr:MAG: hypothetical protein BMS9Abin36_0277 [Gammaproteobacteria bacterium]
MTAYRNYMITLVLLISNVVYGYDVTTHQDISETALYSSSLSRSTFLFSIGINGGIDDPETKFPNSEGTERTIRFLLREGAKFEDNNIRPLFHFFDPVNDEGLLFTTSPNWALEDNGNTHALQDFSYTDARRYLFDALTSTNKDDRSNNFGRVFESLGRVIHHIQDMAQPQHTRLDQHLSLDWTDAELPFESRSRYERYTVGRSGSLPYSNDDYNGQKRLAFPKARDFWVTGSGAGMAEFSNNNFVSAGTNFQLINGQVAPSARYMSPVPNGITDELSPQQVFSVVPVSVQKECILNGLDCRMVFYGSTVQDNKIGKVYENKRASTLSIFDQDLQIYNKQAEYIDPDTGKSISADRVFSLNRFNFDAAHGFLIPRAVAYSAGLIDYFFRGRLEAVDAAFTERGITLKVKNAIDVEAIPEWVNETLQDRDALGNRSILQIAYDYEDAQGERQYNVSAAVDWRTGETLAPGQISSQPYEFVLPALPTGATNVNYRIVFKGQLGQESGAIAVGVAEPISGFIVTPNYVPNDGISGPRVIRRGSGRWKIEDVDFYPEAENIDWKGMYIRGKASKVLTWRGPPSRYFPDPNKAPSQIFSNAIYQNGEVFTYAPCPVYGAAITLDSAGKEWVVTICSGEAADTVYARPNTKNLNPGQYDADLNPEGWLMLNQFYLSTDQLVPNRPWFFNGDGTEAQTIRQLKLDPPHLQIPPYSELGEKTTRLKIIIDINQLSADLTDEQNTSGVLWSGQQIVSGGSGNWNKTYSGTVKGEYVVAVDYANNKEILCKIVTTGSGSGNAQHMSAQTASTQAGSGMGSYKEVLQCDGTFTVDLNSTVSTDTYSVSRSTNLDTGEVTGSAFLDDSEDAISVNSVLYLDARQNYAVVSYFHSKLTNNHKGTEISNICDGVIGTGESTVHEEYNKQLLINQKKKYMFTSPRNGSGSAACIGYRTFGKSTTYSYINYPYIYQLESGTGSWAADSNGNIAVSDSYFDYNKSEGGVYNYLTGGKLETLFPGASEQPSYTHLGVIK